MPVTSRHLDRSEAAPSVSQSPRSAFFGSRSFLSALALGLLLLSGAFMRLYRFPGVPNGLHQDEISAAYESYCLLHTGADRWGYRLPVYFLSWGSGQNVLQSYLSIPVIAVTGLTRVGARFVPVVCGLLLLPLFFVVMRRWHGDAAAFAALAFLAFSPWQVMYSRWGVEYSPLPLFMVLGLYLFGRALQSKSTWLILISLLPFDLSLYTYGITIVVLPVLLLLLFFVGFRQIWEQRRKWLGAVGVFAFFSLPIDLFVLKNYVTKTNYTFERWLPFSVPLLPVSRLSQVREDLIAALGEHSVVIYNLKFVHHKLSPRELWRQPPPFQVPGIVPLPRIVLALALVGIAVQLLRIVRYRRIGEPFLPWLVACVPLLPVVVLNVSRAGPIYLPVVAMAGVGFSALFYAMRFTTYRIAVALLCASLFAVPTYRFVRAYFGKQYATVAAPSFNPDLPAAMSDVQQRAEAGEPIYISEKIMLNYMQTLFYLKVDPTVFQHSGATYDDPDFGPYRFSRKSASRLQPPFVFLRSNKELPLCANATDVVERGPFKVGVCR